MDTRIDDIQRSGSPKSKMASSQSVEALVPHFGNKLNGEVCCGFFFANHFNSLYLWVRLWWSILVANLATNFQDLVAKVKNLVTLVPVLGAIACPGQYHS